MALTDTVALVNQAKPLYDATYLMASQNRLYFDQLCNLMKPVFEGQGHLSYNFTITHSNQPTPTALSETDDVTPQSMRSGEISVTLQEWGNAIELTKFLAAVSYVDVYDQAANVLGYQMAETFDHIVRRVMGQGGRQSFPTGITTRATVDGLANAAHRMTTARMELIAMRARTSGMPLFEDNTVAGVMHPFVWYDLLQQTDVRTMATRQNPELLYNGELAYWSGIRVVVAPSAKAFYGAGAAAASSIATTLAEAADVGDTTIVVAANTNINTGDIISIQDGEETGNTWYDTNELLEVTDVSGTTITVYPVVDPGPSDGLRYAHASGKTVTNDGNVYPLILVGPNSITKACSSFTGPYGETIVVPPLDRLQRFMSIGWYCIAGWTRTQTGWIYRPESGSSVA